MALAAEHARRNAKTATKIPRVAATIAVNPRQWLQPGGEWHIRCIVSAIRTMRTRTHGDRRFWELLGILQP